eukprot:TRINITY_DN11837_c0_g2_i1.p1 TRINITY_DN11837_c0_g2~~TRINITY_DN11837_c0_g2_i1.p1  ORF type:complete len:302 (-),score=7.32 TRINITY_DN11837_c0_g2_i1:37-942(-)
MCIRDRSLRILLSMSQTCDINGCLAQTKNSCCDNRFKCTYFARACFYCFGNNRCCQASTCPNGCCYGTRCGTPEECKDNSGFNPAGIYYGVGAAILVFLLAFFILLYLYQKRKAKMRASEMLAAIGQQQSSDPKNGKPIPDRMDVSTRLDLQPTLEQLDSGDRVNGLRYGGLIPPADTRTVRYTVNPEQTDQVWVGGNNEGRSPIVQQARPLDKPILPARIDRNFAPPCPPPPPYSFGSPLRRNTNDAPMPPNNQQALQPMLKPKVPDESVSPVPQYKPGQEYSPMYSACLLYTSPSPRDS